METIPTIISWSHTLTASASMLLGGYILFTRKGTPKHIKIGKLYLICMLITNVSSLFIYNAFGKWFFPHTLAVVTLGVIAIGYYFSKKRHYKHWLKIHLSCFIISYYMLVGGAINEAFLRIKPLRVYLIDNHPILGISHFVALTLFLLFIFYYLFVKNLKKL